MSPDELLTEWLNRPDVPYASAYHGDPHLLKLLSVQQIDFSSRFDTPNSIEQSATYLVTFSSSD
jgi:hypothetical protein